MTFNFYETKFGKEMFGEPVDVNKEWDVSEIPRPKYSKDDKVVLINGDILSYKSASAIDGRKILVTKNNKSRKFKHRTEFKDLCKIKGWDYGTFDIKDIQEPAPFSVLCDVLDGGIGNALKETGCNKFEVYVEGKTNFRSSLPLIDKYKDREDVIRPVHLKETKNRLIEKHGAYRIGERECDDYIQQRSYELSCDGIYAVTWTIDKDSQQNYQFDINIYNPDKEELVSYKKGVGNLWETSNGIKGNGLKWLVFQSLLFDKIDGYCLNQFYIKRYGEKSFYKDFKDLKTEYDVLVKAVEILKTKLPEKIEYTSWNDVAVSVDWLGLTELYFKCCYMRIRDNDETTFESLLKDYGVEY